MQVATKFGKESIVQFSCGSGRALHAAHAIPPRGAVLAVAITASVQELVGAVHAGMPPRATSGYPEPVKVHPITIVANLNGRSRKQRFAVSVPTGAAADAGAEAYSVTPFFPGLACSTLAGANHNEIEG